MAIKQLGLAESNNSDAATKGYVDLATPDTVSMSSSSAITSTSRQVLLTSVSLPAGTYYVESWTAYRISSTTPRCVLSLATSGTASSAAVIGEWYDSTSTGTKSSGTSTTFTTEISAFPAGASTDRVATLSARVVLSAGGTITLGARLNSGGATLTVQPGTFLRVSPST